MIKTVFLPMTRNYDQYERAMLPHDERLQKQAAALSKRTEEAQADLDQLLNTGWTLLHADTLAVGATTQFVFVLHNPNVPHPEPDSNGRSEQGT